MGDPVDVGMSINAASSALRESALRAADVRAIVASLKARSAILEVMRWPNDPRFFLAGDSKCGRFALGANVRSGQNTDALLDVWERLEELTTSIDQGCRRVLNVNLVSDVDALRLLIEQLRVVDDAERDAVTLMQGALRAAVLSEVMRIAPTGARIIAARAMGNPWLEIARIVDVDGQVLFDWAVADDPIAIDSYDDVMPVGTPVDLDEYSPLTGAEVSAAVEIDAVGGPSL